MHFKYPVLFVLTEERGGQDGFQFGAGVCCLLVTITSQQNLETNYL